MRCWIFGDELHERDAVGASHVDEQTGPARGTTKRCGAERVNHVDAPHWRSQESSRKGLLGLNVIDTRINTGDTGTKYLTATTRGQVVGIDATVL